MQAVTTIGLDIAKSVPVTHNGALRVTRRQKRGQKMHGSANWPVPVAVPASRTTAARFTPGAISLSTSKYFALVPYSNRVNPVMFPPGRARLAT
jgi:hypothetical protein